MTPTADLHRHRTRLPSTLRKSSRIASQYSAALLDASCSSSARNYDPALKERPIIVRLIRMLGLKQQDRVKPLHLGTHLSNLDWNRSFNALLAAAHPARAVASMSSIALLKHSDGNCRPPTVRYVCAHGDGTYEFYTIGLDEAVNAEDPPAQAGMRTQILLNGSP